MRTIFRIFVFLSIFLPGSVSAQIDTGIFRYYPLQVNNSWVYVTTGYQYYSRHKITITDTAVINNHTYYELLTLPYPYTTYQRIDSLTGCILQSSTNSGCPWFPNEYLIDSLTSHLNDSVKCNDYKCTDTSDYTVFGVLRKTIKFSWFSGFEQGENHRYAKGIGVCVRQNIYGIGVTNTQLVGCCLNGIVYGDTTLTGLENNSGSIPSDFSLSQNYPNPFNPVTKIKFDIPPSRGVRWVTNLTIYDVLGREIAVLVNEKLSPGSYEVEWDGTNYPSGVYFFKLIVSDASAPLSITYSETRKMVLIK